MAAGVQTQNNGQHDMPLFSLQVVALNGEKIQNMHHLVKLVDACTSEYLHFDLDYNQKVRLYWVMRLYKPV